MRGKYLVLASLLASSISVHADEIHNSQKLHPIGIATFVEKFLTPADPTLPWSIAADDPTLVTWISKGVENKDSGKCGTAEACRLGMARIIVGGKELHNLRENLVPVVWTVEALTFGLEKFGPSVVALEPHCDQVACAFDPLPDLRKAGFTIDRICEQREPQEARTGYRITKSGKAAYLAFEANYGSGGESDSMGVFLQELKDPADMCSKKN